MTRIEFVTNRFAFFADESGIADALVSPPQIVADAAEKKHWVMRITAIYLAAYSCRLLSCSWGSGLGCVHPYPYVFPVSRAVNITAIIGIQLQLSAFNHLTHY